MTVPVIIERGQWEIAQKLKERNKCTMGKNRKFNYLLGGMQKCGHCGTSASGMTTKKDGRTWAYYVCNARKQPKRYGFKCNDAAFFRTEDTDNAVWEYIRSIFFDENTLQTALDGYWERRAQKDDPITRLLESSRNKLGELQIGDEEMGRLKVSLQFPVSQSLNLSTFLEEIKV